MVWARFDDGYPNHPKVAPLTDAAFRAFVTSVCYCSQYLTDGLMPPVTARSIARTDAVESELVTAKLWDQKRTGMWVHDYLIYNPSRAQVMAERAKAQERRSKARSPDVRPTFSQTSSVARRSGVPSHPIPSLSQDPPPAAGASPPPSPAAADFFITEFFTAWEQEMGQLLSPAVRETVLDWRTLHPAALPVWASSAIKRAVVANARKLNYVMAILNDWASKGAMDDASIRTNGRDSATDPRATEAAAWSNKHYADKLAREAAVRDRGPHTPG